MLQMPLNLLQRDLVRYYSNSDVIALLSCCRAVESDTFIRLEHDI